MSRDPYPCRDAAEFWETETPNADRDRSTMPTVIDPSAPKTGAYVGDWSEVARVATPAQVTAAWTAYSEKRAWKTAEELWQAVADAVVAADERPTRVVPQTLAEAIDGWAAAEGELQDAQAEVERLRKYAPSPEFEALLEASSLGSPEVLALRDTVSDDVARTIVLLAEQMDRAEAAEAKVAQAWYDGAQAASDWIKAGAWLGTMPENPYAALSGPSEPTEARQKSPIEDVSPGAFIQAVATRPEWRCKRCNSTRWVSASLDGGLTRIKQCIPCGRYSTDRLDDAHDAAVRLAEGDPS